MKLPTNRLIDCMRTNGASICVLEKCRMKQTDEREEILCWELAK